MKKNLLLIVALLALTTFVFSEMKIGIINPQTLQDSIKGKEASERLRSLLLSKQKKSDAMQMEIAALEKETMSLALNQETKEKKSIELQNKRVDFKRYAEDAQKELSLAEQKEMEAYQRHVIPVIEKIAKEEGYSLILIWGSGSVMYFEPAMDITGKVVKALDAQAAAVPTATKK
ncbi:MAG: OmpH family outer membrane protein [Candidatus Aminicenantes bacterium]|nr:OmpH family outer membrane protein [Candidatus Aminicenantes bacterium]